MSDVELRIRLLQDAEYETTPLYNTFNTAMVAGAESHFTTEQWEEMLEAVNVIWDERDGLGGTLFNAACCLTVFCCAIPTCCLSCVLCVPWVLHSSNNSRSNKDKALYTIGLYLREVVAPEHEGLHFYAGYNILSGEPFIQISSAPYGGGDRSPAAQGADAAGPASAAGGDGEDAAPEEEAEEAAPSAKEAEPSAPTRDGVEDDSAKSADGGASDEAKMGEAKSDNGASEKDASAKGASNEASEPAAGSEDEGSVDPDLD